ncbi:MAG TPA: FMN-binding negative transcriptional regulator [Stellaceae bacterium]|nr:FMN-binding negative transcriptional regulator [Stellaceae bacterium]
MYVPPHFREDQVPELHDFIRAAPLATLVSSTPAGLFASHLPLLIDPEPKPFGTLSGHLARANPHWKEATSGTEALAIFTGPQAYITPAWYVAKQETGKVVPTWNYAAVHAYGTLRFFEDEASLLRLVTRLTETHEAKRAAPWAVSDAPADFVKGMLRAIVGFELTVTRLEGKWKMSQNRPPADIERVVEGLDRDGEAAVAAVVAKRNRGRR